MRAVVLEKFGGPDSLVIKEIPEPEPRAVHVVIQVKAFGINHAEMHMRRGEWAKAAPVSGIECVGLVRSCPGGEFPVGDLGASTMCSRSGIGKVIKLESSFNCKDPNRSSTAGIRGTDKWNTCERLLRPRTRELNHLGPLFGFVGHELAEVGRRACQRRAAQIGEPRLDIWIREPRIDFLVELVDDFGGRIFLRTPPRSPPCLPAKHQTSHSWDFRQRPPAPRPPHRPPAHPARPPK